MFFSVPDYCRLTYVSHVYPLALERDDHKTAVNIVRAVDKQIRQYDGRLAVQLIQIHPVNDTIFISVEWISLGFHSGLKNLIKKITTLNHEYR